MEAYIIQYPFEELSVSFGMILNVYDDVFEHNYFTSYGSGGSPIINLNKKVIGIHTQRDTKRDIGIGKLLIYPIEEFIQQNNYKNNNKIEIIKENDKNNNLSIQDRPIEEFNLINKYLGKEIFYELDKLFLYFIPFKFGYSQFSKGILLNFESFKNLIYQIENDVYQIKIGNKEGIGFFCKIPFPNKDNMLPVFITNNSVFNEELLNKKNGKISLRKKNNKIKEIILSNRRKYTSKEYNTTIIEIKEEDGIKNYLELDDKIINGIVDFGKEDSKYNDYFRNMPIYIIINQFGILTATYSFNKDVNDDKQYDFIFYRSEEEKQIEGPIFTKNNKLIGFGYKGTKSGKEYLCHGLLLHYPILEFIKKFNK